MQAGNETVAHIHPSTRPAVHPSTHALAQQVVDKCTTDRDTLQ